MHSKFLLEFRIYIDIDRLIDRWTDIQVNINILLNILLWHAQAQEHEFEWFDTMSITQEPF